jgi:hypothetical protein
VGWRHVLREAEVDAKVSRWALAVVPGPMV